MSEQYTIEKPDLALESLFKLNSKFANKPNFEELVKTLLLTLSGQLTVGSSFAYFRLPESPNNDFAYQATGLFAGNELLKTLVCDRDTEEKLCRLEYPAFVSEMYNSDDSSNTMRVLLESEVQLICSIVHNDKLLGFIGFDRKVTNKPIDAKDVELLNALMYSVTPLIVSSYQYWEVNNLNTWYLDILNNVKQGVLAFNNDFRLKKINSSGLAILDRHHKTQVEPSVINNNHITHIFPEDIFVNWAKHFTKAIVENKRKSIENLKVGTGTDEKIYSAYITRIQSGDDSQADFILTLDDVTERNNAEDALRLTKYSLDRAAVGAFYIDKDARFIYVNDSACETLGYTNDELMNMTVRDVDKNSTIENWSEHWQRLKDKGYMTFETTLKTKNGKDLPIEITSNYVEFKNNGYYLAFARDISEKKLAEIELTKGSDMLRATLESTADGLLVVDNDRNVISSNDRFAELWKIPKEILETKDDDKLLNHVLNQLANPKQFIDKVQELYLSTNDSLDELYFKDNRVFERYSCPLIQNGEVTGRVWCLRDISKRVEAEKQEKLLQDKLDHAERMEAIGVMAGGVAHDLNNMLGPLVGYPELILMKLEDDNPIKKQVVKIGQSAKNAADVIQDLLTLARRGRYEMEPININDVINNYTDSPNYLKITGENPEIKPIINLDEKLPNIFGSTPHLMKVIMNLIVNAFDAMLDGGELSVTTSQVQIQNNESTYNGIKPGDYVLLKVKDSGVGIDPSDIDRIFEPYYSKKKMGTSGSGLGLSVVYGIVRDHKAHYNIESQKGVGTEFIFHYPITDKGITKDLDKAIDYRGSESVLIVDDSAEQQDITKEMLLSLGYKVSSVLNGHDALTYLKNNSVDLLLLDMIMEPEFDGLSTYQEIIKLREDQKTIIISGYSKTDRVNETLKLGASNFIKKPFNLEQIGSAIRKELDKKTEK